MSDDRGIQSLVNRMADAASDIAALEAQLTGATRRRRALALKLSYAGWSERKIAAIAGVSGAAVHYMLGVARREHAELLAREEAA